MKKPLPLAALTMLLSACFPSTSTDSSTPSTPTPPAPTISAASQLTFAATVDGQAAQASAGNGLYTIDTPDYSLSTALTPDALQDSQFLGSGPEAFTLKVANKTSGPIKVVWDDSAISVNGSTSIVFHLGVKYTDRAASKPASIIPPGASLNDEVYPADYTRFLTSTWYSQPMFTAVTPSTKVSLLLGLDVNGKRQNVNLLFAAK